MTILGTFYGNCENQTLEFKEFYLKLHPDTYLDDDTIYEIITTGRWHDKLNMLILDNIKYYLKVYIPKYVSCYFNSQNNGKLIIGINDIGEITGIPFNGTLNLDQIKSYIMTNISQYITGINALSSAINVSLVKVNILNEILEDNVNDSIETMHENLLSYKSIMKKYKQSKEIWFVKISKYCVKIYKIINDSTLRQELIGFIKDNNGSNTIIKLLENNNKIPITLNEEFYKRMKDKNDVIYWATSFKDHHIEIIQLLRPKRKILPILTNSSIILSNISDMRYKFINSNENINYYLIVIDIFGKNNKKEVRFRLPNTDIWYSRTRVNLNTGPGCI
jgi:hypothetical protein